MSAAAEFAYDASASDNTLFGMSEEMLVDLVTAGVYICSLKDEAPCTSHVTTLWGDICFAWLMG